MPYYLETDDREELKKLLKYQVCAECESRLEALYDIEKHLPYLQCKANPQHEGIQREASRYEKEGLASLTIKARREIMVEEHGETKTMALDRYLGTTAITKVIATELVESLWGAAPAIEKTKCILLCLTYQLNPLMKHLYLIGYKRKENGKYVVDDEGKPVLDWSIQMGIGATRLLAQRKHNYSYLDMSPRKATQAEIDKILGDTADPECIYGFVHIKDTDTGAEAFGLRGIKKDENIKGVEKGNTHLNMACVRAERQALDRQYPGEMPPNVEVVDERYIDAEYKIVDRETGEITEPEPTPAAGPKPKEHWCEEHKCAFVLKKSRYGSFYAHKTDDPKYPNGFCNEKKKGKATAPQSDDMKEAIAKMEGVDPPEGEPPPELGEEQQEKPQRDPDTIRTLNELFKACNEDFGLQPAQVVSEIGVASQTDISDSPADCYRKVAAVS